MVWSALSCCSGYGSRGWDHFTIFTIPHTLYMLGMTWAHVVPLASCWAAKLFPLWYQCVEWLQLQLNPKLYSSMLVVQQHPQAGDIGQDILVLCALGRCRCRQRECFCPGLYSCRCELWGWWAVVKDKQSVHAAASATMFAWFSHHISLAPPPGFALGY